MIFIKNRLLICAIVLCLFYFLAISTKCHANQFELSAGDVLDKIVAVVGKEIILQSDIDAYLLDMLNRGEKIDINDKDLRQRLLNEYINEKLLVTKAEEDSVQISDEMIDERYDVFIQGLINYYGSIERIESLYKKSLSRLKLEYKDEIKKQLMSQELVRKKFSDVSVSSTEIEEYYGKLKDSLPMLPEQVELYHIYKVIEPDTMSKNKTIELARKIRDSIIQGADFGEMAVKYSEDPGSKSSNGELGWIGKGKFVAEFERAALNLQPNEISMPIESPFGYHIIKLIAKNKDSINTAHILLKLIQSEDDIQKVKTVLDSIRNIALDGNNFEELAKQHSEDKETKGFGGLIGKLTLENSLGYADIINNLKDGEISEPISYSTDPTKQGMHIVWRKQTIQSHKPSLDTDYDYIKAIAINYKTYELRAKWLAELRDDIYLEVFE